LLFFRRVLAKQLNAPKKCASLAQGGARIFPASPSGLAISQARARDTMVTA